MKNNVVFAFLFIFIPLVSFSDGYVDMLKALYSIDMLPVFRDNMQMHQISSYDRTGGNDDGFSGKYSFIRKEGDNLVIADLKGNGVIQRIWTPTPTEDTIQFFFGAEKKPRISIPFIDLFSGKVYPFVRPVVGNEVGGYYCYLPVNYQNGCKIIYKGKRLQFIQIQYFNYTDDTQPDSFPIQFTREESDELAKAVKLWGERRKAVLELFGESGNIKAEKKSVLLEPGSNKPIFEKTSGGRITGIEITALSNFPADFKSIILKAKWDDDSAPAINCPLTDFFGYAFGEPSMRSIMTGVEDGVHYCYFPMPFKNNALLELEYLKDGKQNQESIPFKVKVFYSEEPKHENEGKYYTKWNRTIADAYSDPYEFLNINGHGHFVGTSLQAQGKNPGMTLFFEGDDVCTVDGEMRAHGTGSEDFFNGGWYALPDRWDQGYSLPLHGSLTYSVPLARTGGFRFYLTDKIPFHKSFKLTIEHGPEENKIPVDYTSVSYYYSEHSLANNPVPNKEMLYAVQPPTTFEYWLQLLPVKAMSSGSTLVYDNWKDEKANKNYEVFSFSGKPGNKIKFELEVPGKGEYKLYVTFVKGPEFGDIKVSQRQVEINNLISAYSDNPEIAEKVFIGNLNIEKGTNSVTFTLGKNQNNPTINTLKIHRLYLEKM